MHRLNSALLCLALALFSVCSYSSTVATILESEISLADVSPDDEMLAAYAKNAKTSKELALLQYRLAALTDRVLAKVMDDYLRQHQITREDTWVSSFLERFSNVNEQSSEEEIAYWRNIAEQQIRQWQFDKLVYDKFKGTVVFRNNHPQFPVEAYARLLAEYRDAGQLRFLDNQLGALFWQAFQPPYRFEIAPENINLSAPWWAQSR